MSHAVYLSTELHQQLGSIRTVGSQAAYCCAEVGQTRYGFASLGGPTGPFSMAGTCCRTGGKSSSASCCQAHQPDQSSDVSQTKRLQTCCKAAARATVWKERKGGGVGRWEGEKRVISVCSTEFDFTCGGADQPHEGRRDNSVTACCTVQHTTVNLLI